MPTKAADAVPGKFYRPTRGAMAGEYYTVHPWKVETLIHRIEKMKNPYCRDLSLLADLKRNPDWPLFIWHLRGTDPFTGNRYEVTRPMLLDPTRKLRCVKTRPGYTGL